MNVFWEWSKVWVIRNVLGDFKACLHVISRYSGPGLRENGALGKSRRASVSVIIKRYVVLDRKKRYELLHLFTVAHWKVYKNMITLVKIAQSSPLLICSKLLHTVYIFHILNMTRHLCLLGLHCLQRGFYTYVPQGPQFDTWHTLWHFIKLSLKRNCV